LTAAELTELFERHHGELYRYAARFTGDPDLAEDLVQDSFVRLAERPPADPAQARTWLYTTATRLAIDAARQRRRRAGLLLLGGAGVAPTPLPDPAEVAESGDLARRVRAALAELGDKERSILLMRTEGFTHREIAAAVGTTTGSVGTLIARSLDKLARRLKSRTEALR
jgi:RNA polymerase sigma-70 factor (ECF subfamily)